MRSKLISIFLSCFLVCVGLLVWHVDKVIFADRLSWAEAQARAQMSALVYSSQIEIRGIEQRARQILSAGALKPSDESFRGFLMVGELVLGQNSEPTFKSTVYLAGSEASKWGNNYSTVMLKSVDSKNLSAAQFFAFLDPQRKPKIFMYYPNQAGTALVAILETTAFQALVDRQKGQISQVFLVNGAGQTLAHTEPEYVASDLSGDPLVAKLKSGESQGFGLFADLKSQQVQGLFEQVGSSNVFVVISTSLASLYSSRTAVLWQLGLVGLGLSLVAVAFLVMFYKEKPITSFEQVEAQAIDQVPQASETKAIAAPSEEQLLKVKMEAYSEVASSLAHELKGPLAAILGHVRLAKVSPQEGQHLQLIEEEGRQAREIIRKLLAFARQDDSPKKKHSLRSLLEKATKNMSAQIGAAGIKFTLRNDIQDEIEANESSFVYAIEQLIKNSIEAMDKAPRKELSLITVKDDRGTKIVISDSGAGMEPSALHLAFDPFYTTKSKSNHRGMGLSSALGIVKDLGGNITLKSKLGNGTTAEVSLPIFTQVAPPEFKEPQTIPVQEVTKTVELKKANMPQPLIVEIAKEEPLMEVPRLTDEPAETVVFKSEPEILVNDEIERMIDEIPDQEMPDSKVPDAELALTDRLVEDATVVAQMPPPPNVDDLGPSDIFSSKIDRPNINIQKRDSVLEQTAIIVRRPGAKS